MSLGDLSPTIARFGFPMVFREYGVPTVNADGFAVVGGATDTTALCHLYPAPGRVLDRLPQGHKGKATMMGGTTHPVKISTQDGARGTDVVHGGRTYEVIQVQHWTGPLGTGGFYEFVCVEVTR